MRSFQIRPASSSLKAQLLHKIDNKTKPLGALGRLERLALQIALAQDSLSPRLTKPAIAVFAGDHGIALEGVSAYPQAVTAQMVLNFLAGGAAINVFARQHDIALTIVDAGVNHDFGPLPGLVDAKIGHGTRSFLQEPAMSAAQCELALERGAALAESRHREGCNVFGCGEMGIGNTSSAALLTSLLTGTPVERCVGRGTGLDDRGLDNKRALLATALARHPVSAADPLAVLATFGGFEIAMMTGAMLQAAALGMIVLVDGFIAGSAFLAAAALHPAAADYAVFCHRSAEPGHAAMLAHLGAEPLLDLGMRLGEGSGAAVAYPLLVSAVSFLNEMASFESAGVSREGE